MAEHTVVITLTDGRALMTPNPVVVHTGDTVRYDTEPAGLPFRVVFDTPFGNASVTIQDRAPRTATVAGRFFAKCSITGPDGTEVEWDSEKQPDAGGEHDVRPAPQG